MTWQPPKAEKLEKEIERVDRTCSQTQRHSHPGRPNASEININTRIRTLLVLLMSVDVAGPGDRCKQAAVIKSSLSRQRTG